MLDEFIFPPEVLRGFASIFSMVRGSVILGEKSGLVEKSDLGEQSGEFVSSSLEGRRCSKFLIKSATRGILLLFGDLMVEAGILRFLFLRSFEFLSGLECLEVVEVALSLNARDVG